MIVGGIDEKEGPQVFQIEASGTFYSWKATSLGKGQAHCKQIFEKRYNDDMDIEDAIHTAIMTLKETFEGELTERNIEIGIIRSSDPKKEFKVLST